MTTTVTSSAIGFASLEEEVVVDSLPVTGTLPAWLQGSLLRTGPAKFEAGEHRLRHWFDGLAMVHRYTFGDGAVSYGNRFLESRAATAMRDEGRIGYGEFATDPCRSLFKRVQTLFSADWGGNANVNVVKLGDRFLSMTEARIAVEFDPRTLETVGVPFLPPGQVTTAHPHEETDGAMLNLAVQMGAKTDYRFFRLASPDAEPQVFARVPTKAPAYVHSFGLTERYVVLTEFPLVVNPMKLALAGKPYIENYVWKPGLGTRFTLVDRATGAVGKTFTTDAFFGFHHVNCFDDGDDVVVDLSVYPDAAILDQLYLEPLRAGAPLTPPQLRRFRLGAGGVTHELLVDEPFELGQISYATRNGRPYRVAWGVGTVFDRLVRADVVSRTTTTWHEDGCYPGEPVFVARPGASAEDDGVLLSVVLDARAASSFLLCLDARTMTEVARATVPHVVPFSFHGRFAASVR